MKVNGKKMRDRIISLVNQDNRYANDDKLLIATIWFQEGWKDPDLYTNLKKVSSAETIRSTRAKLCEEGVIKPSEKTIDARYDEFTNARKDLDY